MTDPTEDMRLQALRDYAVLDTASETAFDRLTSLAAALFDAPIALVSLVDAERQWFKSRQGIEAAETPRSWAFCAHAIKQAPGTTLVVEDATRDPRFAHNPLVTGEPDIRFYAGAVLTGREGHNLGTLCVIDRVAREAPSPRDLSKLSLLAEMVIDEMELRRVRRQDDEKRRLLEMAERMSGVGHWRYDVASGDVTWSDEVYRIHGVQPERSKLDFAAVLALYHPEDQALLGEMVEQAVRTGAGYAHELRIRRPDGEIRNVVFKAECESGDQGDVKALYGVFQDISTHRRTIQAAERSRARYKLLADNVTDVIFQIGLDGRGVYSSPSMARLIGYTPAEMVGCNALSYIYEADRKLVGSAIGDMSVGVEKRTVEYRAVHKDGRAIWVEARLQLIRNEAGIPSEIIGVIRDISDRKAMELELTAARDAAEALAIRADHAEEMAGLGHWRFDVRTRELTWSKQLYRLYGFDPAEPPDLEAVTRMTHPEDRPASNARVATILAGGIVEDRTTVRLLKPDGDILHLETKWRTERSGDGAVTAAIGTVVDVTQRVRTEQAIADSELKYRTLAENSTDIILRFGRDGLIRYVSPACRILGLTPDEVIGTSVMQFIAPDSLERTGSVVSGLFSGAELDPTVRRIHKVICKDGREIWLEGNPRQVLDANGEVVEVITLMRDVSARREIELALAASEQRFRALADNAPDMLAESRLDGTITYVSPACLPITGFTQEELIGRSCFSLMSPQDAKIVRGMCDTVLASKGAIAPWPVEYATSDKAGRQIWLECKPCFVTDPSTGRITGVSDVIRDITARKALETELRQAKAEAEAATAVKGDFLANMSHELRTPLTSILGYTRLAIEQQDLTGLTRGYVERVGTASRALLSTVNDILDFSKLEAGQVSIAPQPTALAELTRGTLELFLPQAAAKGLDLALEGEAGEINVLVDPDRVRQILLNLVGNAVKFTTTGSVTLIAAYDREAQMLSVEVVDTGDGIPPETLKSLFKRFSQVDGSLTRSAGGTGLGLAICKGLVEAMGGEIGVRSQEGHGSCFWFRIPAPAATLVKPVSSNTEELTIVDGLRVLIVDDHATNRELAGLILTAIGAAITEAKDGVEAASLAAEWPFDVILMDLRMPHLDGAGALAKIRRDHGPNTLVPILAFSADVTPEITEHLIEAGFAGVVAKPLNPEKMIEAVVAAIGIEPATPSRSQARAV